MSAYVIFDITVNDPEGYEEYKKLAPAVIESFGGKYLTRGGKTEVAEGDWSPNRVVILEFETVDRAKAWLGSPEYAEVSALRHATATSHAVIVEGV